MLYPIWGCGGTASVCLFGHGLILWLGVHDYYYMATNEHFSWHEEFPLIFSFPNCHFCSKMMADEKIHEKATVATNEGVLAEHHYPAVDAGTGATADRQGAHAKKVHNVSFLY